MPLAFWEFYMAGGTEEWWAAAKWLVAYRDIKWCGQLETRCLGTIGFQFGAFTKGAFAFSPMNMKLGC